MNRVLNMITRNLRAEIDAIEKENLFLKAENERLKKALGEKPIMPWREEAVEK